MKPLSPAMKRVLIDAVTNGERDGRYHLRGYTPRTLGALDDRGLIAFWGELGAILNTEGVRVATDLATDAALTAAAEDMAAIKASIDDMMTMMAPKVTPEQANADTPTVPPLEIPTPADVTRMILAGDDAGLQAAADALHAANGEMPPTVKCGCEHTAHFDDNPGGRTGHAYQAVSAGNLSHPNVGPICTPCAKGCLADYAAEIVPTSQADMVAEIEALLVPVGWDSISAGPEIPAVVSGPASADPALTVHTVYTDALKPGMVVKPVNGIWEDGRTLTAIHDTRMYGDFHLAFSDGMMFRHSRDSLWQIMNPPTSVIHIGTWRDSCASWGCPGCYVAPDAPSEPERVHYQVRRGGRWVTQVARLTTAQAARYASRAGRLVDVATGRPVLILAR